MECFYIWVLLLLAPVTYPVGELLFEYVEHEEGVVTGAVDVVELVLVGQHIVLQETQLF